MERATWESVLDDLEHRLVVAERLLASGDADASPDASPDVSPDWEPPAHLDALPPHLVARAQQLLDRPQAVPGRIPPLLAATRQQHLLGQRIGQATTRPTAPVYLDVTA